MSCLSNWTVCVIKHLNGFFFTASKKKSWNFLCFDLQKSLFSQLLLKLWLIGNRTPCHPIQSVIIVVIKQIILPLRSRLISLITHLITDRIGLHSVLLLLQIGRHKVLLPINHNYNKICDILGFFKLKTQKNPGFFTSSEKKKAKSTCHSTYCPIIT